MGIERVYVTRIIKHQDGTEQLLEKSETVAPLMSLPEDDELEHVETDKDKRGRVQRLVTVTPSFICKQQVDFKEGRLSPDGNERLLETKPVEPEETKEITPPVIKRILTPTTEESRRSSGVFEQAEYIEPFAVYET